MSSWLDDDQRRRIGPWIDALEQIDKWGNKEPLLALLRSEREQPHEVRVYFADLIERYELTSPAHRPRTPAYDLSNAKSHLEMAKENVRAYQDKSGLGMSFKDAVAKAAEEG